MNDVATVEIIGSVAYFDPLQFMGRASDFIGNADKSPVALSFDNSKRTVIETTLEGHMLEGMRTWKVNVTRNPDCSFRVHIVTEALERKVGLINDWGAWAAGTEEQMKIWDYYLKNIRDALGGTNSTSNQSERDMKTTTFPGGLGG